MYRRSEVAKYIMWDLSGLWEVDYEEWKKSERVILDGWNIHYDVGSFNEITIFLVFNVNINSKGIKLWFYLLSSPVFNSDKVIKCIYNAFCVGFIESLYQWSFLFLISHFLMQFAEYLLVSKQRRLLHIDPI